MIMIRARFSELNSDSEADVYVDGPGAAAGVIFDVLAGDRLCYLTSISIDPNATPPLKFGR